MVSETRYMRSDTWTVNGLLAYKLLTSQSASALSASTLAATPTLDARLYPIADSIPKELNQSPVEPPPGPYNHYDNVDDLFGAPNDTDYVYSPGASEGVQKRDAFTKTAYTIPVGKKVGLVRLVVRGRAPLSMGGEQGAFFGSLKIGGGTYDTPIYEDEVWTTKYCIWDKNPNTGLAWTQADLNNLLICAGGISMYDYDYELWTVGYVSMVHLEVYVYTDVTISYAISIYKRSSVGAETLLQGATAAYSITVSALYDSPGLKSQTQAISPKALASTDSIVIRVYQRIGAGSWTLVQTFTTEVLGAQSLDAVFWNVYYYLSTSASTTAINSVYSWGHSSYDSKITFFTWTPAPRKKAGLHPSKPLAIILNE